MWCWGKRFPFRCCVSLWHWWKWSDVGTVSPPGRPKSPFAVAQPTTSHIWFLFFLSLQMISWLFEPRFSILGVVRKTSLWEKSQKVDLSQENPNLSLHLNMFSDTIRSSSLKSFFNFLVIFYLSFLLTSVVCRCILSYRVHFCRRIAVFFKAVLILSESNSI